MLLLQVDGPKKICINNTTDNIKKKFQIIFLYHYYTNNINVALFIPVQ